MAMLRGRHRKKSNKGGAEKMFSLPARGLRLSRKPIREVKAPLRKTASSSECFCVRLPPLAVMLLLAANVAGCDCAHPGDIDERIPTEERVRACAGDVIPPGFKVRGIYENVDTNFVAFRLLTSKQDPERTGKDHLAVSQLAERSGWTSVYSSQLQTEFTTKHQTIGILKGHDNSLIIGWMGHYSESQVAWKEKHFWPLLQKYKDEK